MANAKERTTLTLDARTKAEAKPILDQLGMSLSTYVDISLGQLVRDQGMPFTPSLRPQSPRRRTREEILREMDALDEATPADVQAGLAALTIEDERRMLGERDA